MVTISVSNNRIINFIEAHDISIIIAPVIPLILIERDRTVLVGPTREKFIRRLIATISNIDVVVMPDAHIYDLEGLAIIRIVERYNIKLVLISSVESVFDIGTNVLDLSVIPKDIRYHGFVESDEEILSVIEQYMMSPLFTNSKSFILYTADIRKWNTLLEHRFNSESERYNLDRWKSPDDGDRPRNIRIEELYLSTIEESTIFILNEYKDIPRVSGVFDLMTKRVPMKSIFCTDLPVGTKDVDITQLEARQRAGTGICYRFCSEEHFKCLKERDRNITLDLMTYARLIDYGLNPLIIFPHKLMVEECGLIKDGTTTNMYKFILHSGLSLESGMVLWKLRDKKSILSISSIETLTKSYEYFNYSRKYGKSDSSFLSDTNCYKLDLQKRYQGKDTLETVMNVLKEEEKREQDISELKRPAMSDLDTNELVVSNLKGRKREFNVKKDRLNAIRSLNRHLMKYIDDTSEIGDVRGEYWKVGDFDDTKILNVKLTSGGNIPIWSDGQKNYTMSKYSITNTMLNRPLNVSILSFTGNSMDNILVLQ